METHRGISIESWRSAGFRLASAALLAPAARPAAAAVIGQPAGVGEAALPIALAGAAMLAVLAALLGVQVLRLRHRLRALENADNTAQTTPPPPASPAATATAETAPEATFESSRRIIQDLVRNLNELIGGLIERNATQSDKMAGYRVSIHQAMTVAGLEEIERLLLREIDEMQESNALYRTQLEDANARLREQEGVLRSVQSDARTDSLTHLPNRRAIDEALAEEFARTARYATVFSLMLLDIDHFKRVNDTYGHPAGDKVLQVVAHFLETQVRQTDKVGRYGGEEFMVVMPETGRARARRPAEKIREAVEAAGLMHERKKIQVTLSAGVSEVAPGADETPEAAIARADAALYRAKQSGRNRVETTEAERIEKKTA